MTSNIIYNYFLKFKNINSNYIIWEILLPNLEYKVTSGWWFIVKLVNADLSLPLAFSLISFWVVLCLYKRLRNLTLSLSLSCVFLVEGFLNYWCGPQGTHSLPTKPRFHMYPNPESKYYNYNFIYMLFPHRRKWNNKNIFGLGGSHLYLPLHTAWMRDPSLTTFRKLKIPATEFWGEKVNKQMFWAVGWKGVRLGF